VLLGQRDRLLRGDVGGRAQGDELGGLLRTISQAVSRCQLHTGVCELRKTACHQRRRQDIMRSLGKSNDESVVVYHYAGALSEGRKRLANLFGLFRTGFKAGHIAWE